MKKLIEALDKEITTAKNELDTQKVNKEYYRGKIFAYECVLRFVEEESKNTISNTEILKSDISNMRRHIETMEKDNMRMRKLLEAINVLTRGE